MSSENTERIGGNRRLTFGIDRMNDWIYNRLVPDGIKLSGHFVRLLHNGKHTTYLIWSLVGLFLVLKFMLRG